MRITSQSPATPRTRRRHLLAALVAVLLLAVPAVAFSSDTVVATVAVGVSPAAIAVDPVTHHAFVANYGSDTVSVVDAVSDAVDATLPMPKGTTAGAFPIAVVSDALHGRVYIGNYWSDIVSVVDGSDFSIVGTVTPPISHGSGVRALGVDPSGAVPKVYAAVFGQKTVSVIDGSTNAIVKNIAVGDSPRAIGVFASGSRHRVYVANRYTNDVSVIDGTSDEVVGTVGVGAQPKAIAVDPDRGFAYVSSPTSDTVTVIDDSDQATATITVGDNPIGVGVDAVRRRVFVANYYGNNVSVIDADTLAVVGTVPTGANPYAVAVDQSAGKAFVSCYGGNSVTVIDASLGTVNVPVGTRPYALAIDEGLAVHKTFAGNWGSNSVSVIDPAEGGSGPVTVTVEPIPGDTTSTASPVITGSAASDRAPYGSTVLAVFYRLDGGESWRQAAITEGAGTPAVRWEISSLGPLAEGPHRLEVVAMDQAMAVASSSDQGAGGVSAALNSPAAYAFAIGFPPLEPPATTLVIVPAAPDGENGWYRTAPSVTLTADQPVPTYYAWDDAEMSLYAAALTPPPGTHVLSYRSGDEAHGFEATQTVSLSVDTSDPFGPLLADVTHTTNVWSREPSIVVGMTGGGDADSGLTGYRAAWSASDSASPDGPASLSPLASTVATELAEGEWYVAVQPKDVAGNFGTVVRRGPYLIDTSAPQTTDDADARYDDEALIHLSATDGLSGVAETRFRLDGGAWQSGTAVSAGPGTHSLEYYSVDGAGNTEQTHGVDFAVFKRYEEGDPFVLRSGKWSTVYGTDFSGGSCIETDKRGTFAYITFVGTSVSWISPTGPSLGIARVILDDEPAELVSLYSASAGSKVWTRSGRAQGTHTLIVEWTGIRDASKGTAIGVDAFDVDGELLPSLPVFRHLL